MVSMKALFVSFTTTITAIFIWNYFTIKFSPQLNVAELIQSFGYPLEIHQITTDDGYILTLHRIPSNQTNRLPILFVHGFVNSAAEFVNLGPQKALSLLLSDHGYDIWLANSRGTTWSRQHTILDPDSDPQYWNFSFHEVGTYDLPKMIDYILNITNKTQLHYIGYSQGCSAFFIMGAEKPEYSKKVKLMTALAPAVYIDNPQSPLLRLLVRIRKVLEILMNSLHQHELFAKNGFVDFYLKGLCNEDSILIHLCLHQFFIIHGYSEEQVNKTMFPTILSNLPAGISSKHICHTLQLMNSGRFEKFDFGPDENRRIYNNATPPVYDMAKIQTPVALYYSTNDWIVLAKNIEKLPKVLPNIVKLYKVPWDRFNHNDFLHANDVVPLLYNSVIEEILKY